MWNILNNGPFIHTFSFNDEVNKPYFDWAEEDLGKIKLGFKVKHLLIITLTSNEFCYVFTYESSNL